MRAPLLTLLALGSPLLTALADEPALTAPPRQTVYLEGPRDLARLRETNPAHYARARRVLAAADHLCRPATERLQPIAGSRDARCEGRLLFTSNPPQWQMTFTLDDTRYVAMVVIHDDPPRLVPAHQPAGGRYVH
jgi:hypothetical protein